MIYHDEAPRVDRRRIEQALDDIKTFGDSFQVSVACFIEESELVLFVGPVSIVRGSGSVQLDNQGAARDAVAQRFLTRDEAAGYVRLNIARETIDTGGQRGIEGTLVHEGKHALDFAMMLSTFSSGQQSKVFHRGERRDPHRPREPPVGPRPRLRSAPRGEHARRDAEGERPHLARQPLARWRGQPVGAAAGRHRDELLRRLRPPAGEPADGHPAGDRAWVLATAPGAGGVRRLPRPHRPHRQAEPADLLLGPAPDPDGGDPRQGSAEPIGIVWDAV